MESRHFFVSRSGVDQTTGVWLCKELSLLGYSYHAQEQWPPGSNFVNSMNEATSASEYTLAIFSKAYFAEKSPYTNNEWTVAHAQQKLIGVMVERCEIPDILIANVYIDLTRRSSIDDRVRELRERLEQVVFKQPRFANGWTPQVGHVAQAKPRTGVLPFLCDRESQGMKFETLLECNIADRPIIVIVDAGEEHRPDKLSARLQHVNIPQFCTTQDKYGGGEAIVRAVNVPWISASTVAEFVRSLDSARKRLQIDGLAPEDVIVVSTEVLVEQRLTETMRDLLPAYIDFWQRTHTGTGCLVVICLSIRYPEAGLFQRGLRKANENVRAAVREIAAQTQQFGCTLLSPLAKVPRGQVNNWLKLPDVEILNLDDDQILEIFDNGKLEEMPMAVLAPRLKDLIERNAQVR